MPKNIKGGNKTKKGKNTKKVPQLVLSSTDTKYAVVVGNLGNGRCNLNIVGKYGIEGQAQGYIRGCVRRAKFVKDDLVLCGIRDFGSNKEIKEVDIIFKYTLDHYNQLVYMGEIKSLGITIDNEDCGVDFTNDSNSDNDLNSEDEEINNDKNDNNDEKDENDDDELLGTDRKIKLSTQKKLDKIPLNGKKSKAVANIQRDMKKLDQLMSTQVDDFRFDDI